LLACIFNRLQ